MKKQCEAAPWIFLKIFKSFENFPTLLFGLKDNKTQAWNHFVVVLFYFGIFCFQMKQFFTNTKLIYFFFTLVLYTKWSSSEGNRNCLIFALFVRDCEIVPSWHLLVLLFDFVYYSDFLSVFQKIKGKFITEDHETARLRSFVFRFLHVFLILLSFLRKKKGRKKCQKCLKQCHGGT